VSAFGGKYVMEDNSEIPDTLEVVFEYPASPVSGKEFVVTWSNATPIHMDQTVTTTASSSTAAKHAVIDREGYTLWPERSPTERKRFVFRCD